MVKFTNNNGCITALLCIALTSGCKKNNLPIEEPIPEPIEEIKKYLPIRLESGTQITTLEYLEGTSLLSEMKSSDGRRDVFKYNKDKLLLTYERYADDKMVYSADYFRNAEAKVNKVTRFNINPNNYTPAGYYTLSYTAQDLPASIKWYDNSNKLSTEQVKVYDALGNLTNTTTIQAAMTDIITALTYDQRNGIFKYVDNSSLFAIEARDDLFLSAFNNILTRQSAQTNASYSYVYNMNNYPAQYTVTTAGSTKTGKITYKILL